jgi:hypothetical protein
MPTELYDIIWLIKAHTDNFSKNIDLTAIMPAKVKIYFINSAKQFLQ